MASPITSNMGIPSCSVIVGGKDVGAKYGLKSIVVSKEINKVSKARIIIMDGNPSEETFEASASKDFDPDKTISIKMGYDQKEKEVFSGVITGQSLKVRFKTSELIVTCMDKAFQLASIRKTNNYSKKKDSDVISEIIGAYGLTKSVATTTFKHPNLVQYNCSDWDFILARADANAMVVINEDAKLTIAAPVVSGSAVLDLNFGLDIIDFSADMDSINQLSKVEFQSWDSKKLSLVKSSSTEPAVNAHGDITGKKLAAVVKNPELAINTSAPEDSNLLKSWANSHLQRSRLSKIRGFASFVGNSSPVVGKLIKLSGFSPHFNGLAYVTKVIHYFEDGFWKTESGFGLEPSTFTDNEAINGPASLGLLPSISGLHIGKVKKIHDDPAGEYRIQVDVPFIETAGEGLWARMSQKYATTDVGIFFYPEIGDEVILGFINDDPRYAIILGSLYRKKKKPANTPKKKNNIKSIVTASKIRIEFNDEDKSIFIRTPGEQKITLDDKESILSLEDMNGNSMVFDKDGIHITSCKDIDLKADKDFVVKASNGEVSVKGKKVAVEGTTTVQVKGKSKLSMEGPTAELKGSGKVIIKGGMVNIN